jgi:hypothetical protein
VTATQPTTLATSNVALSHAVQPLMGWRHPRTAHRNQLTHAVMRGRTVAECGVVLMAIGEPWPKPGAGTPLARCSICTHSVHGLWERLRIRPDVI